MSERPDTHTEHEAADLRAYQERTFDVSACERLRRSNRQYQDEHGYYIPTLAWLLNETRRERDEALAALAAARGKDTP